jgi:putative CocE/NonD family hydrolase
VTALASLSCAPTRIGSWWLARQLDARPAEFAVRVERGVAMTTSDGVALVADVYHPDAPEPAPTILVRIPFPPTFWSKLYGTVVGRFWAERGYRVVLQGTRGRYESGGTYYPLRDERRDGVETLQWLAGQPWFDGRLGMWGGSYFGYTQWVIADRQGPGPSALMIQLASTSFYEMFHPGGAFSLESALVWAIQSYGDQGDWPSEDTLRPGYEGFPLLEADDRAFGDIPAFDDWVRHASRDSYWREIDGEDRARRLAAPVLLMAGWFDPFLPTGLADFVEIRADARPEVASASRLVVGPWAHARSVGFPGGATPRNYRLESLEPSVPWFDRWLLGAASDPGPPVRIYVMGADVWRDEQEWPLARARYVPFYLQSSGNANSARGDGSLTRAVPMRPEPADWFEYDPRKPVPSAGGAMIGPRAGIAPQDAIEARPDVLVYSTPALAEGVEVTGPVRLVLFVTTSATETDFTGKLVDVHPDGRAFNVCEGILRRRYAPSDRPVEIAIDLWPTSMLFREGHRIRLEVSSSSYPRFDRNPNTGRTIATETEPIVATQAIHHGADAPSRLILPIVDD